MSDINILIDYLKDNYTIKEVDYKTYLDRAYWMFFETNEKSHMRRDDYPQDMCCFIIGRDSKSEKEYEEIQFADEVFLILNKATGYMESNSSSLLIKSTLAKGISAEEVQERPSLLWDYVCKARMHLGIELK